MIKMSDKALEQLHLCHVKISTFCSIHSNIEKKKEY